MTKKLLIGFTSAIIVFGLLACSAVKIKVAEGVMEQITGMDDIQIDESGGSATFKSGDEEINIESSDDGLAWPADKLPGFVPQLNGATIDSTMDVGKQYWVIFENCSKESANAYADEMKALDWEAIGELEATDGYTFSIQDDAGNSLQIAWSDDGSGTIIYAEK